MTHARLLRLLSLPLAFAALANLAVVAKVPLELQGRRAADARATRPSAEVASQASVAENLVSEGSAAIDTPGVQAVADETNQAEATASQAAGTQGSEHEETVAVASPDSPATDSAPDWERSGDTLPVQADAASTTTAWAPAEPVGPPPVASLLVGSTFHHLGVRIGSSSRQGSTPAARPIAGAARWFASHRASPRSNHEHPPADAQAVESTEAAPRVDHPSEPEQQVEAQQEVATERIITIRNPAVNGYPVAFLLNGQVRSLGPGESLEVTTAQANVQFDRGGEFGESSRELQPGKYLFRVGGQGWVLVAAEPSP